MLTCKKIHQKKVESENSTIAETRIKHFDQEHALHKAEFKHKTLIFQIEMEKMKVYQELIKVQIAKNKIKCSNA